MTEYTFEQLVDITLVKQLLESHHRLSGMAYGIFDADENNLIAVAWQDICVRFHRVHPVTSARCRESDAFIKARLHNFKGDFFEYRCKNGMIDVAMPIIIDGKHLATFFTGQFFYEDDRPDTEYFLMQAETLGFDREEYLKAQERVPVFSREHIRANVLFLHNMMRVMAEMGLKNLRLACEVAERKRTEKRLALMAYALDHVHEAAFLVDEQARFLYVNEEACRRLGYSREEMLWLRVADVDPDFPLESWADHWRDLAEHGTLTFEGRHRTRGGCIFPVEINANYFEYDGQGLNLALVRDISDRKRLESEVIGFRDFLSNVINAIADPVFVKDAEHRLVLVNDAECALAGASREELLGKTDYDFFPREQVDVFWRIDDQVLADGELNVNEEQITDATGRVRTIVTHKSRYIDPQDNRYIVGVIRDITERKKIEHELRLLNFALDHVGDAAFLIDEQARFHYVNEGACRSLGYDRDQLLGMGVADIDADITKEWWRDAWPRLREAGVHTVEARHKAADGHIFPVEVTGSYFEYDGVGYDLALARDITDRKQIEDALRENERKFRTLAESLPDNIIRYDRQCRATYCNSRLTESVAIEKERFLGRTPLEAHPETEETAGLYERTIRRVVAGGAPDELEFVVPHPDGGLRTHLVSIVAERDTEGAITGALAIGRDISERKQAEAMLRKHEQQFRALVENSPDFIARYDEECRRVYVNPAMEKLFGRPARELVGRKPSDMSPLSETAYFEQLLRQVRQNGREGQTELPFRTAQGETRWCHFRIVPEFDSTGTVTGTLAIGRDINALKEAEKGLRASEQRFREIFDNSLDCLYLLEVTEDGRFRNLEINPASERSFGISRAELIGRCVDETVPEETGQAVVAKYRRCVEAGTAVEEETELDLPSGRRNYHSTLIPVRDDTGRIYRIIGITCDITERKRYEKLEKARLRLFERLAQGAPLSELLDLVTTYAETTCPHFHASIMLVDAEGKRLLSVSGPRLPADYAEAVNGIEIGDGVGSCGTAVWRGESVIVEDIETHPYWAPYKDVGLRAGFRSCWSDPIFDSSGKVVGTFGIYQEHPGAPSEYDRELIRQSTHLAAIVIERTRMEERLRLSEQKFRTLAENSPNIIIRYDRECRRTFVNPAYTQETGIAVGMALDTTPDTLWSGVGIPAREYRKRLEEVMESGIPSENVLELRQKDTGFITSHAFHVVAERNSEGEITGCLAIGHNITALKEAELRLTKLAETSPGVIYSYLLRQDGTSCMPYVSSRFEELCGLRPEDVVSGAAKVFDRIHPDDVAPVQESIAESARTLSPWHTEFRMRHPEMGDVWVEGRSIPECQTDGSTLWYGFLHDITERKRIEAALQKIRRMLEEAQRIAHIGSWEFDLVNNRLNWSDEIFRIFCIAPERFGASYEAFLNAVHPDDRELVNRAYTQSVASRTPYEIEHRLLFPDGSVKFVHERGETLYDMDGTPLRSIGTVQDITERKHFEIQLQRRERQYRNLSEEFQTLLDGIPDLIIHLNPDLTVIWANKAATEYCESDIKGRFCHAVLHDQPTPCESCPIIRAFASGEIEKEVIVDKKCQHWGIRAFPLKDSKGRVVSVIDYASDITERKRIEESLRVKREQLAAATVELSLAEERERLRIASELHDHIGQTLLLGRIKLGTLAQAQVSEPVRKTIDEARELLDQATHDAHSLTVQLNPPILAAAGLEAALEWLGKRMEADYGLRVVFENDMAEKPLIDELRSIVYQCGRELLINVAKHGSTDHARLIVGRRDDMYLLAVEDEGAGFDPATLVHDISKDCRFGLFSIQLKIERLGGSVVFDSAPGRGSRMTILVPLAANNLKG